MAVVNKVACNKKRLKHKVISELIGGWMFDVVTFGRCDV